MRKFLIIIGCILLPTTAAAQNIEGQSLYEYIHEMTKRSTFVDITELPVERFTAAMYFDEPVEGMIESVTEDIVDPAITSKVTCSPSNGPCVCSDPKSKLTTCLPVAAKLKQLANHFAWQRQLGRDLQMIATGYETGISDYPGHAVSIVSKLSSIARIWKTSNERYTTPFVESSAAGVPFPEDVRQQIEDGLKNVVQMIKDLEITSGEKKDLSEQIAAVWRYKNGVKYVSDREGACSGNDPGLDELALLKKRWCDVEDKMNEIHGIIQSALSEYDLPVEDYILFPSWKDEESNIFVWIRIDDIGLEWYMPLEPVQPMYYTQNYSDCVESDTPENCTAGYPTEIIRGGTYPPEVPEPEEQDGVCSHPFGKNGYLCRPVKDDECVFDPIDPPRLGSGEEESDIHRQLRTASGIVLTKCEPEQFADYEPAPDQNMCAINGWPDTPKVKDNVVDTPVQQSGNNVQGQRIIPGTCSECAVDHYCADDCGYGQGFAFTFPADENGTIPICYTNWLAGWGLVPSLMIHEMVHAHQMCGLTPAQREEILNTREECCALEGAAYAAQCDYFAEKGILSRAGYSYEQCAATMPNSSCRGYAAPGGYACNNTSINMDEMVEDIVMAMLVMMLDGSLNVPTSCPEALNNPDQRVKELTDSLPPECNEECTELIKNVKKPIPISKAPSGPDLCEIGGWKDVQNAGGIIPDTPDVDDDMELNSCSLCAIDMHCESECEKDSFAVTAKRNDGGIIRICVSREEQDSGFLKYALIRALVQAQQSCYVDDSTHEKMYSTVDSCCANNREAYMATCDALAEDFVLEWAGADITIDACATALASISCQDFAKEDDDNPTAICMSRKDINPEEILDRILEATTEISEFTDLPLSCEDAITNLDPRAESIKNSMPLSCAPGCISEYDNTIGNNLCFAGQCLEQSHEWHRLIPGRMTLTSGDEAFPWDACAVEDPQYGRFFSPPALGVTHFPVYNPQRLYDELDLALCQLNGLPAKTPPTLCRFDPRRRLNATLNTYMAQAQSLAEQPLEYLLPAEALRGAAPGVAARFGDDIFLNYMRNAAQGFADIFGIASDLIEDIGSTQFPNAMCPRQGDANSCDELVKKRTDPQHDF